MRLQSSLKYNVKDLIDKIQKNRKSHKQQCELAKKQYQIELKEELEEKLNYINEEVYTTGASELIIPVEYTSEYDKALDMLKLTSQQEIELDQNTFCQLVRDEWDWKRNFNTNTVAYATKFGGSL